MGTTRQVLVAKPSADEWLGYEMGLMRVPGMLSEESGTDKVT